jgi:hypothetical protein
LRNPSPAGAKKAFLKSDHISLPHGFADQQHHPADQIGSDFLQSNTDAKSEYGNSQKSPKCVFKISGLLASFGKTSREALISKEPTKVVEQLSVNSRCNSIYKILVSTPVDIALQTVEK